MKLRAKIKILGRFHEDLFELRKKWKFLGNFLADLMKSLGCFYSDSTDFRQN